MDKNPITVKVAATALIIHSLRLMTLQHSLVGLRLDSKKAVALILAISFAASWIRFFNPIEPILQTIFLLMVIGMTSVRVGVALALLGAGIDVLATPATMLVGSDSLLPLWELVCTVAVLVKNRKWIEYDKQSPHPPH